MASHSIKSFQFVSQCLVLGLVLAMVLEGWVWAADPDITEDFGIEVTSGEDLRFRGFRSLPNQPPGKLEITHGDSSQFAGLKGMGISPSILKFGPQSLNPFHSHPRAGEFLFVLEGELEAGVVATNNKLYRANLVKGDVFVFPRGLMHFQINRSSNRTASALAAFNSEHGGRVSLPAAIFNSEPRIHVDVVGKSLNLDRESVERLQALEFPTFSSVASLGVTSEE